MALGTVGGPKAVTDSHGHYVRAWVSRHDNGWEAWVCEDEHGDFHAWTCPSGAATVKRDPVECTETHGKRAALLALEYHTGHRCGVSCSSWQEHRTQR
jgi:uncharacterized membrane protein